MHGGVWGIVVAAGQGQRYGRPKQFERLGGRLVLEWSIESTRAVAVGVVLVLPEERLSDPVLVSLADRVVAGGASRAASVRAGLAAVPEEAEIVLVHDAARPLASPALFRAVLEAVRAGADGAIPGLQPSDTMKRVAHGRVLETLDRDGLVAAQTPQAFRAEVLRAAHRDEPDSTDDAGLLEAIGASVAVVPGDARNVKLTEVEDLVVLEQWMAMPGGGMRP